MRRSKISCGIERQASQSAYAQAEARQTSPPLNTPNMPRKRREPTQAPDTTASCPRRVDQGQKTHAARTEALSSMDGVHTFSTPAFQFHRSKQNSRDQPFLQVPFVAHQPDAQMNILSFTRRADQSLPIARTGITLRWRRLPARVSALLASGRTLGRRKSAASSFRQRLC